MSSVRSIPGLFFGHLAFHGHAQWMLLPTETLSTRPLSARGAEGCPSLGQVYAGEEQVAGWCGHRAVFQVAQDAFELSTRQIGFDIQESFQVPSPVGEKQAGVSSAPGCGPSPQPGPPG